jgi:hypothetical protein
VIGVHCKYLCEPRSLFSLTPAISYPFAPLEILLPQFNNLATMYPSQTYTKWALVPLWSVHILLDLVLIAAMAFAMLEYSGTYGYLPA